MNVWYSLYCLGIFHTVVSRRDDYDRIGYFWQITDIHYDAHFNLHPDIKKGCWKHEFNSGSTTKQTQRRTTGDHFGEYGCDSTWELVESAAKIMSARHENVEFVLWTGDALSHASSRRLAEDTKLELVQNITDLLGKTFPSQFVFPALGHDDATDRRQLGRMWARWLPTDSMKTFESGGYYIIERKMLKLQLVVLNTNLMKRTETDEEASKQWKWLDKVLHKFQRNGETVYLIGHIPPGWDERQRGNFEPSHSAYTDYHGKKYLEIVRKYSGIIAGQFFGHLHVDTFRIIYGENGRPVSWAMVAPSVTPRRNHAGRNNPALRLYKFNKDTGQVFDYSQYYLDLSATNANGKPEWAIEYNFSTYYGLPEVSANNLHTLANQLVASGDEKNNIFDRYLKANSVRATSRTCDLSCVHTHYCSMTRIDQEDFENCLKTAAVALSSTETIGATLILAVFCLKLVLIV